MKFLLATTALVAAVSAQAFPPGFASCAFPCFLTLGGQGCKVGDNMCWCSKPAVQDAFKTCIPSKCQAKDDVKSSFEMGNKQCAGATGWTALAIPA